MVWLYPPEEAEMLFVFAQAQTELGFDTVVIGFDARETESTFPSRYTPCALLPAT